MSAVIDFLKQLGSTRDIKAAAISAGIQALTGTAPITRKSADAKGEYIEIIPTERQVIILREYLDAWLSKEPGDVRVDLSGIWWPTVAKRTGLWASGALALSAYLGRKYL